MASLQARFLGVMVRVIPFRRLVEWRLGRGDGAVSAKPGKQFNGVAAVVAAELRGRTIWHLEPLRPTADAPLVIFLHGGGYVTGVGQPHWWLLADVIRRSGAAVWVPDYPLAPQHTAAVTVPWTTDVYAVAIGAVQAGRPVVLMGDSAGGGLALAVAVAAKDRGLPMPAALVLLSPWLDVGMTAPDADELDRHDRMLPRRGLLAAGKAYAGAAGVADPLASPLFADLTGLPPATVFASTTEGLIADARRLAARAAHIPGWQVDVRETPDMVHDWLLFGFLPEARAAITEIAAILAAVR
jgi:monoterpene epsilon-lactone hydrolase